MALQLPTPNMRRSGDWLVEMVGVNFLLRMGWDRAYRERAKCEHQGRYS